MINSPLGKLIRHPVDPADAVLKLVRVTQVFGLIADLGTDPELPIALAPFCTTRPLCYFSREGVVACLDILNRNLGASLESLELYGAETSRAIYAVLRETDSWKEENTQRLSKPQDLLRFDRLWHPEYQRYSEHAFNHLTRIPLELLQRTRGKNYQALELAQRAQKLEDLGYPALARGFNPILRNAISHGGVHYSDYEIRYVSRNADESLSSGEFLKKFDELVDTCSAYVAALIIFVCQHFDQILNWGINRMPLGLRYLLLRGFCDHPGFSIEGILEAGGSVPGHLNLYCTCATKSQPVHLHEALHSAVQLHRHGLRYPVIAISIECGESTPASLIINGDGLTNALIDGASAETLTRVVQTNLLWHQASRVAHWCYIFSTISRSSWTHSMIEVRQRWRALGFQFWKQRYIIRKIDNRSVGNLRRVLAEIVVKEASDVNRHALRKIINRATRQLRQQWIRGKDVGKMRFLYFRPAYVWLRIHIGDARVRDLESRNYADEYLIATSEWTSIWRRGSPVWVKAPDEIVGALRIKWHK